jgi:hypothetical protein
VIGKCRYALSIVFIGLFRSFLLLLLAFDNYAIVTSRRKYVQLLIKKLTLKKIMRTAHHMVASNTEVLICSRVRTEK